MSCCAPQKPDVVTVTLAIEVIGAGFGRTGTSSLYAALNTLGFKTHHMIEVMKHGGQAAAWLRAARDRATGRPIDWRSVLGPGTAGAAPDGGYTAAVDWPGTAFYKELLDACPGAKVVLTLRDFDDWYDSARDTVFAMRNAMRSLRPPAFAAPLFRRQEEMTAMVDEVIWGGTFGGRFEDREHVRQVYDAHIAEVRRVVPPGQLLEFRMQDGWAPLCAFVGKPVPEQPFPHVNDAADFKRRVEHVRKICRRLTVLFAVCNTALVAATAVMVMQLLRRVVAMRR